MKSFLYAIARLLGTAKWVAVVAFVLVIVTLVLAVIIWVPQWQVAGLRGAVEPQELFDAENSARVTLVQIVGGIALLIGLYGGWRNFLSLQKNVNIAEQRQIAERFTRAIDQLGNKDSLEVRLGGIYALGQIAKDSPRDYHQTVVEVLAAYVRENAPREASGEEENGEEERPLGGGPQGGGPREGNPLGNKPRGGNPRWGKPRGGSPRGGKPQGGKSRGNRSQSNVGSQAGTN